jgi:hypothetical protein
VFPIHAVPILRRNAGVAMWTSGVEGGANLLKINFATGWHSAMLSIFAFHSSYLGAKLPTYDDSV